jgi:hypothetical protein
VKTNVVGNLGTLNVILFPSSLSDKNNTTPQIFTNSGSTSHHGHLPGLRSGGQFRGAMYRKALSYGASNMVLTYRRKLEVSNCKTLIHIYIYIYICFRQTQKYIIFQIIANELNNKILLFLTENVYIFIVFQFYSTT